MDNAECIKKERKIYMKNFKKIVALSCAAIMVISSMSMSVFAYSDCDNEAVETLTKLEVLSGYDDGTFKPDALISRAEFAKIISVISGGADLDESDLQECGFSDVDSNHWAYNYILYCETSNYFDGYEDGTYKPNENVSFAEVLKVCLTVAGYNNLNIEKSENWYEKWVDLAYEYNLIDNKDKDPNGKATRAEVAELVSITINLPICRTIGYEVRDGVMVPITEFADGTVDKNGEEIPFSSLLTKYFQ